MDAPIGPQPNIDNLHAHIIGIAEEIALLENGPALPAIHQLLLQLQQQQQQQHVEVLNRLDGIQASLNRIPMQLYNVATSSDAPLQYPQGIDIVPPLPITKKDLSNLTIANCNATIAHLGLPPMKAGATVAQCQQYLMDYLGCGLLA